MKTDENDASGQQLVLRKEGILGIKVDLKELKERYTLYEDIKKELLNPADYADIKTKGGIVKAIRKSGWFKFATAFGLSITILEERKEVNPTDPSKFCYHFTMRSTSFDGKIEEDVGSCDNGPLDREGESEHVIRAMACTRGSERVIIKMVGANEVAAEDYTDYKGNGHETKPHENQAKKFCEDKTGKHIHNITNMRCETENLPLKP